MKRTSKNARDPWLIPFVRGPWVLPSLLILSLRHCLQRFLWKKKIVIREMFYWTYWWPRFINDMNVKMYVEAWCYYKQNVDDRRPAHLLARRYFEPQKGIRPTTILWQRGCSKYCGYGDDSTCVEPTPQLSIWFQEAQWLELPTYDQKVERSNPRWGFKSSIFCKWARRTSTYRRQ